MGALKALDSVLNVFSDAFAHVLKPTKPSGTIANHVYVYRGAF